MKGAANLHRNCPACGAPITDDARFCSHCGTKLPDDTQRIEIKSEIKIEDAAKLEEVRLKHELEERKWQEKHETKSSGTRYIKIKLWVSWLICIASLCVAMVTYDSIEAKSHNEIAMPCFIIFIASGIYAIVITFSNLLRKIRRKK